MWDSSMKSVNVVSGCYWFLFSGSAPVLVVLKVRGPNDFSKVYLLLVNSTGFNKTFGLRSNCGAFVGGQGVCLFWFTHQLAYCWFRVHGYVQWFAFTGSICRLLFSQENMMVEKARVGYVVWSWYDYLYMPSGSLVKFEVEMVGYGSLGVSVLERGMMWPSDLRRINITLFGSNRCSKHPAFQPYSDLLQFPNEVMITFQGRMVLVYLVCIIFNGMKYETHIYGSDFLHGFWLIIWYVLVYGCAGQGFSFRPSLGSESLCSLARFLNFIIKITRI